jgi:actin-like ATPase involved in cell morphogenesis
MPVTLANEPFYTVVRGCGRLLENYDLLKKLDQKP